jgi:hypothetical protein
MTWTAWLWDVEWRAIVVTEGAVQVGLTTSRWVVEQREGTQTRLENLSISNSRKTQPAYSLFDD